MVVCFANPPTDSRSHPVAGIDLYDDTADYKSALRWQCTSPGSRVIIRIRQWVAGPCAPWLQTDPLVPGQWQSRPITP